MPAASLPKLGILAHFDNESIEILSGFGQEKSFQANEVIVQEGDTQSRLYIVVFGSLEVVGSANEEVILAELQPGDCFGETSILEPGTASATVRTVSEGKLWYLEPQQLQDFFSDYPFGGLSLVWGINSILCHRISHAYETLKANEIVPQFLSIRSKRRTNLPTEEENPDT